MRWTNGNGPKGLVVNHAKPRALEVAGALGAWLERRGLTVAVEPEVAGLIGWQGPTLPLDAMGGAVDLLLVLGGDGTILATAKRVATHGTPLLGVNLGHLGFLTEVEEADLYHDLPEFLAGRFVVDERAMLSVQVSPGGEEYLALNEVVVTNGRLARTVRLRAMIGGVELRYVGDGLIVATPTGSTAYSLAAGGPVLHPSLRALVVTPVCPLTLRSRPIVISASERVHVEVSADDGEAVLTLDGQEGRRLRYGEGIDVTLSAHVARLVRREDWSFFRVLRRKLAETDVWGDPGAPGGL